MKKTNQTIEQKIDEVYDELFRFICEQNDDLHELMIVYAEATTGKTIIRSWKYREERLKNEE